MMTMSKHTSTPRREARKGAARSQASRLPSGSLPLRRTWPISLCVGLAIGSIAFGTDALAGGPTGGVVVGGSGSILQGGNETVINQISQRLALNWETFNLKSNESVLFNQPGRSAVALNRILDQNPSQIFGKINSNGQVFLINTHGIIFGATAQMNVGGLMASTLDLTPNDFLAGNYSLNAVGAGAGIVNHGLIQAASGGSVALVGGSVVNDGVILANYGSIHLDGADHAVLDFDGNGLINIQITGELKQRLDAREAAVSNKGTLQADDGTVVLQASAAKDLFTNLVNNAGVIDAKGISTDGGVVRLVGNGGNVENSGSINVSGVHGGSVQLLSDQNVRVSGSIDASGAQGGGSIRVGGGYQGGEGLQRAAVTYVGPDAALNADAKQSGSGGSVVVWSDTATGFMGNILARGGTSSGDGGNVEVSSHGYLEFDGNADLRANHGVWGTLLLDPNDVTIQTSGTDTNAGFNTTTGVYTPGDPTAPSLITSGSIVSQLGSSDVNITTLTGFIDVKDGFDYAGSVDRTLTLSATGALTFDTGAVIAGTGTGNLSGVLIGGTGGIVFNGTSGFNTNGGNLSITSGATAQLGTLTTTNLIVTAAGDITQAGVIRAAGPSIFTVTGGVARDITLNTQSNQFNGSAVTINTSGAGSAIGTFSLEDTSGTSLFPTLTALPTNLVLNYTAAQITLPASLVLGGNLSLTAGGGILLAADTALNSSGGAISLDATINGAHALAVNTSGATTFGGAIGGTSALTSLSTDAGGSTTLSGNVTTSGSQTYNDAVLLGSNVTLTTTNSDVAFADKVDNATTTARNLTVNAGVGAVTFTGAVGSNATNGALGALAITGGTFAANTVNIGTGGLLVSTTGAGGINQNGAFAVTGASSFNAGTHAVTLNDGANDFGGAVSLTGGNVSLVNNAATVLGAGTVGGTLDVSSNGAISQAGALAVTGAATFTQNYTTAGATQDIDLGSQANDFQSGVTFVAGTGAAINNLALQDSNATPTVALPTAISGNLTLNYTNASAALSFPLTAVTIGGNLEATAGGGVTLVDDVTTTGTQNYHGAVTLAPAGTDVTLTGSTVTLETVAGAAHNLGIVGNAVFNGALTGLGTLSVGGSAVLSGNVTTSGAQTYTGAVTLTGDSILTSTGTGTISFGSTLDGAHDLAVSTGGLTNFGGAVGGTNALNKLSVASGAFNAGTLNIGAGGLSVTTTGAGGIGQGGTFTVAGASSFNAGGNAITLGDANNDFGGAVSLTGGATTVVDKNALALGTLSTGALNVTSAGALNLGHGAIGGNLAATSNGGAITEGAGGLQVSGASNLQAGTGAMTLADAANHFAGAVTAAGQGVTLRDSGDLTIASLGSGINGTVSLTAGGALTMPASSIDTGTADLTLVANGGALTTPGALSGANITLGARDALTLGSNLTSTGTASLTSTTGAISQSGGVLTATILTGSSVGDTTLNGANQVGTLGSFTAANFVLTNAQALAVNGPVDGGASTTLTTTTGDLAINGAVKGTATTLTSAGAISEGAGGVITAATLTGSSVGNTTLAGANQVGALGAFTSGGNFNFNDTQTLTVSNAPSANGGAGDLTLSTTGASSDLILASNLSGNTVTFSAGRDISQTAGAITATTLTGNSVGSATLNGANRVGTLCSFSAANFALTNAQALAVTGPIDGGASTSLTTTTGDLAINGAVKGIATTLTSAGAISEGAGGAITADTLTGSSVGATTLNGANQIGTLGSFTAANFALTNAQALTVTGPINGGASTSLTTTAGDLAVNGAVNGTTATLTSAGAISEGAGGVITVTTLTGSSAGSTSLLGANQVGALNGFTTGGDFGFNDTQTLTVSNAPSANGGAGNLTLTTGGASSDLILASNLTGNTVTLGAGRDINQTAGAITATTLTGSSAGSTTLNGANRVGTLGSFTAANFALTNAQALVVAGAIDGGASTALTTTTGDLAVNGAVNGTTTSLKSAGAISEDSGGSITADTVTGQSTGATALNGSNHIGTLGSFTAANFALTNAQALTVTGAVDGGALTALTTPAASLAINGAVTGNTTTLQSAGAISEGAGGAITAGTLTGQSGGATALNGSNHIGTLGSFTAANFALTKAQALAVTGPLEGGAGTALATTTGDLLINGTVSGTATTLTLASVGGSAFTVNAGTSAFYLSVTHGDLFQLGTAQVYNGVGAWGSTGRMGKGSAPIYVVGTGLQSIINVGLPPAYFYAVDSNGNLLPLGGGFAIIVPSGLRLPPDQQSGCDPDQPDQSDCQDPDSLGMVLTWPNAPR